MVRSPIKKEFAVTQDVEDTQAAAISLVMTVKLSVH